jgi:hypothetical protein
VGLDLFLEVVKSIGFLVDRRQVTVRSALMKEKTLQVLLVEDNAGDVRLLREMFRGERPDSFELTHLLRIREAGELSNCRYPIETKWGVFPSVSGTRKRADQSYRASIILGDWLR